MIKNDKNRFVLTEKIFKFDKIFFELYVLYHYHIKQSSLIIHPTYLMERIHWNNVYENGNSPLLNKEILSLKLKSETPSAAN